MPAGVRPRIYTHSNIAADEPGYLALGAPGMGIPFYREMKVYLPRFLRLCADDFTDAIVGLASNPARRRTMADAARRYALSRRWGQSLAPLYVAYRSVALRVHGRVAM